MLERFKSILLVDDDKITNHFNKLLLEGMELSERIQIAYDGREALDMIRVYPPPGEDTEKPFNSLIFLDLTMPEMNGLEFLEELARSHVAAWQNFQVVLLTSSQNNIDIEKVRTFKVKNVLWKPLTIGKVRQVIKEAGWAHD
jgi:CheY-like chemotaxis protein